MNSSISGSDYVGSFRGIARRIVAISSGDVYRVMAVAHGLETGPLEPEYAAKVYRAYGTGELTFENV